MTNSRKSKDPPAEVIAEQSMNGWRAMKPTANSNADTADVKLNVDAVMPSNIDLKKKYRLDLNTDALPAEASVAVPDEKTANVTLESGPLRKSVGVSGGKVIWRQG